MRNFDRRPASERDSSDDAFAAETVEEPLSPWDRTGRGDLNKTVGLSPRSATWQVWLSKVYQKTRSHTQDWAEYLRLSGVTSRDTVLRYTAHGTVLVAITATLGLSHVRLADVKLPAVVDRAQAASLIRVSDSTISPTSSEAESYARRAVVPRTETAIRVSTLSSDAPALPGRDDVFAVAGRVDTSAAAPVDVAAPAPAAVAAPPLATLIRKYAVRPGDVLGGIAYEHEVTVDAIVIANPSLNGNAETLLQIGQELVIPPVGGVLHTVQAGDTLEKLAEKYETNVQNIVAFASNRLSADSQLTEGELIFVPGARFELPRPAPRANTLASVLQPRTTTTTTQARTTTTTTTQPRTTAAPVVQNAPVGATGRIGSPVFGYVITQYFWAYHNGVDLAAPIGTPVYASDGGRVIWSGWDNTGYGYMLLIDHGNGFRTRYAHLSWIFPSYGEWVSKGQLIGRVGSTGRSSGPHLHFEVIVNGITRNPFAYIQ